jgi:RimJ/RimL family protein N-acetyltransferase
VSRSNITRYQVKAVVFDIQAECRGLKKELSEAGIVVIVPFFGLQVKQALQNTFAGAGLLPSQCLMLTNNRQHAEIAAGLGMAVAGCMEGHFEVPKSVTLLESPEEVSVGYLNQVFCHEKRIPATIAETCRCFIREMTAEDMDALYEILTEEETAKYLPAKAGSKEEELEKLISYVSCVYSFFGYGYWGVFCKETGALIGRAGFKEGEYPLEAGYVIKRSEWGKGYATEVLAELVRYAKEELDCAEIIANIDERNIASLRVAEKCGVVCNRLRM